jgi:hypothetical protein
MNDENQENEALKSPVILTLPASLTVPGFGFLVALNPDCKGFSNCSEKRDAEPTQNLEAKESPELY